MRGPYRSGGQDTAAAGTEACAIESRLRQQLAAVQAGSLPRREFISRMCALGLSAPLAGLMLMQAGAARGAEPPYLPTRRGGGGALKLLFWQGPTLLNPHFANGTKDDEACQIFYEALARWDAEGNLVPVLAAQIPSRENGGLAADGRSVTWKLKQGVRWHDGQAFTADDFVFNARYASDPATAAVTLGSFSGVHVEKIDTYTVRTSFDQPRPFWPGTLATTALIPRHLFEPYAGARSRDAPHNLRPVGTGPYRFVEFKPGDLLRGELNKDYHRPNRPHFDSLELKGGGDAVSAARAVLQTGEFDYAWNLLVEDEILLRLESSGKGRVVFAAAGSIEFITLNFCDPWTEVEGERAHLSTRHPILGDAAVRQALALLVDRQAIQNYIYGRAGRATANFVNNPARFRSPNLRFEFNIAKARALLDSAGWQPGRDGIREKAGRKLKLVFQTSINAPRQKTQSIIKQAAQQAGIELELKGVTASVFFSSDVANPDTVSKFWADIEMYTNQMGPPDPQRLLDLFVSWEASTKANKWQGRNVSRWRNAEYDRLYRSAEVELDPVRRAALMIRMNDLIGTEVVQIPLVHRSNVAGMARQLVGSISGWSGDLSTLADWYRQA
jgi:peptide/nickel transport system substrate-binding protein